MCIALFDCRSWRGALFITLCDKVCQLLAACREFYLCTPVYSINKADRYDKNEILLKVALHTIITCFFLPHYCIVVDQ